jgi:hypothetical protein
VSAKRTAIEAVHLSPLSTGDSLTQRIRLHVVRPVDECEDHRDHHMATQTSEAIAAALKRAKGSRSEIPAQEVIRVLTEAGLGDAAKAMTVRGYGRNGKNQRASSDPQVWASIISDATTLHPVF